MSSKLAEVLEQDAVNVKWNNAIVKQIKVTRPYIQKWSSEIY